MKLFKPRKLNQRGALSLHTILPVIAVMIIVGCIGGYVVTKSKAASNGGLFSFYADANYSGASYSFNPKYTRFGNFSSTNPYLLDRISSFLSSTPDWTVCVYNNRSLLFQVGPSGKMGYVGTAWNDKADYFKTVPFGTKCPSS